MKNYITVEFKNITTQETASINLYSKFTCIYGEDSGQGKSEALALMEDAISLGEYEVTVSENYDFSVQTAVSLPAALSTDKPQLILIDEVAMLRSGLLGQINKSHHVFICISRYLPFKCDYPLMGLYQIERTKNKTWFKFTPLSVLPLIMEVKGTIVTEAEEGHSENELLNVYFNDVTAAGGVDRIETKLRNTTKEITVFADLANIGRAYRLLKKRCDNNPEIKFYDYLAFEELLFKSPLVGGDELGNERDPFYYSSLEVYYEKLLEEKTKNTELEYKHGRKLAHPFLDKANCEKVFDSDVGRGILNSIKFQI